MTIFGKFEMKRLVFFFFWGGDGKICFQKTGKVNLKQNMKSPIKISLNGENSPQKKFSGYLLIDRSRVIICVCIQRF